MTKRLVSVILIVFFAFSFLSAGEKVTITGVVQALETDDEGGAISTYLETAEDSITIAATGKGLELNKYVGYKVEITGVITSDEDGDSVIKVESYTVEDDE